MNWKQFLASKNLTENDLGNKSAEELGALHSEYFNTRIKSVEDASEAEVKALKDEIKTLKEGAEKYAQSSDVTKLKKNLDEALEQIDIIKDGGFDSSVNQEKEISKFIEDNIDEIKSIASAKTGFVELTIKAPANITTGNGTNNTPPSITGVQQAPASNVGLRGTFVDGLVSKFKTNQSAFAYTEMRPKDGSYKFLSEGETKPQIDFEWETNYAKPKKIAAWIRLTDESVQDVAGLQSIATDFLRKKHDLKKQNGILFGDGSGANPKGATKYGRSFVAGGMAEAITNPNIMDVINACVTDIFTTYNYEDEESFMPSLVVLNPTDFYIHFTAKKDGDGKPLYPTASLFNTVNIGGMTIIPERSIPTGKIFASDMSKYNTTDYIDYTVRIGYTGDDFIKNQFVILGESRFHAFVKKLDEQAFIYDDIVKISDAIEKTTPLASAE